MDNNQAPSFEIPKTAENPPVYNGGQEFDPNLVIEGTRDTTCTYAVTASNSGAVISSQYCPAPADYSGQSPLQQTIPITDDSHIIADDIDVMEKEWVDRAKKIP